MVDTKVHDETALASIVGDEEIYVVATPSATPADRKSTINAIKDYILGTVQSISALTATWTSSGTTYTGIGLTVTDTASSAASYLLKLSIGSTVIFGIRKDGALQFGGSAFSLQTPDSTTTGGNTRGTSAVDLQLSRNSASQVASGTGSFVAGINNTASGAYAVALGSACTASGYQSFAGGGNCAATNNWAFSFGNNCGATSTASFVHCAHGSDRGTNYSYVQGMWNDPGQRGLWQYRRIPLTSITNSATPAPLCLENDDVAKTINSGNVITLPNDSTFCFEAMIVARRTDADGESAAYKITGVIDRNTNAASTAFVGSPVVTVIAEDSAGWDVSVAADTTLGALTFTVTGEASKTIRWAAAVKLVEING